MSPLRIRPATISDVGHLQSIEKDAAKSYGSVEQYEFCLAIPPRDHFEHERARIDGVALAAEFDETTIGLLLSVPLDGRAHMPETAVAREFQGRGVGRALLIASER